MLTYLGEHGWAVAFSIVKPLLVALIRYLAAPKANLFSMVIAENIFPTTLSNNKSALLCTRTPMQRWTAAQQAVEAYRMPEEGHDDIAAIFVEWA
jgi:hypothetical protein